MDNYNYGFNTPRFLTNPAYYHKLISCSTFIYLTRIAANKSRAFNVFKLNNTTVTLPYAKNTRDASLDNVILAKGWNDEGSSLISTLLSYRNSQACIYKNRIDDLIDCIMSVPVGLNYAQVVKLVDSHIVAAMFQIARKPLHQAPSLVTMRKKTSHDKSIDRISALISQNLAGFYPSTVRVGLSTYKAGIEIESRPDWIKAIECQKMLPETRLTSSIVNLLGEFADPMGSLNEAYTFVEVNKPFNGEINCKD
ncbi:hypothetical protein VpasPP24_88 [Vibrio phage Vpas_PP24]|nr:hypothetical protein VpasPP24_88 [Vibrio phage Vpas_PP24]